jgi:hypothetical protein
MIVMRALIMSQNEDRLSLIEEYEINGVKRFKFRDTKTGIIINVSGRDENDAKKRAAQISVLILGEEEGKIANSTDSS